MNQLDLRGRTAIVTGGAKGIGYATAARMLESGAAVCLWDSDERRLAEATKTLSDKGEVHGVAVDVGDAAAVAAAMEATLDPCPVIDIMIANAGIAGIIKNAWDYTLDEWHRLIRIDLTSVFLSCRAVIPHMLPRKYGRIVIVSSIAGMEGAPKNAAYSAAKAGAVGFTKALGKELAQSGIIVNCVTPSGIETELLADVTEEYLAGVLGRMPIGRLGTAEEAASLIAWLASEDCSFSTGAIFDLSGGRAVY
jgi:2-dehydro-3-deoxy-L-rhamnonate dehydrogenase (NAD+)